MAAVREHRRPSPTLAAIAGAAALVLAATASPTSVVASADDAPVTIMAAGDIAGDRLPATATGDLIRAAGPSAVLTLGDNAYPDGALADYTTRYEPTWGSFKHLTRPVPGNHEYHTPGAAGYVEYFGAGRVTNTVDGGLYYAWDVGNGWRAYAVNTQISTTDAQLTWLRGDLAAHPAQRYVLYTHRPRYTSGANHGPSTAVCPLWNALADTGRLEIVLSSHNHQYERFAPMDCAGQASADGAASFVVGTGGAGLYAMGTPRSGSQFRNDSDHGVLQLVLHSTSFEWRFLAAGTGTTGASPKGTVLDSGTQPTGSTPANVAPSVDAGPDLEVILPAAAALDATVTDDGLPAAVTHGWTQVSGPGTVTFADPAAVDTTASFSDPGTYVLRLSATDSELTSEDTVSVTVAPAGTPGNVAPLVDAGPDLTVTLPASAVLDGTVTDDGLPAAVTHGWSKDSGPGTVTFADPAAVDTTASFSDPGTYVLRLSATDSELTSADTVSVTVAPAPSVEVRVAAGADDAEQKVKGSTSLSSSDLELIADGSTQQVVGIRFPGLRIPPQAKVTSAWVQFQVDEVSTEGSSALTIGIEAAVDPPPYTSGSRTITSRAVTGEVPWRPDPWPTVGAAGPAQRTPELASLVQLAVDRGGWASGNAVALQLTGTGRRTAEAVEGSRSGAPLLHVEFTGP